MPDILTTLASAMPDKIAVIDDRPKATPVTYTFAELETRANAIAHTLIDLGATPGMRVAWCGQNSATLVAIINACRKVGVVAVPLNYRLTKEQLDGLLKGAPLVLSDEVLDRIDAIVPPGTDLYRADGVWRPPSLTEPALRRRALDDRAAAES